MKTNIGSFKMVYSIAIPVLGQANFLATALSSIQAQTCPFQLAVMDATPNHSVRDVLENFAGILSYRRHGQDSGQSAAIQEGWDHTDGDIFAYLNSDDFLLPGSLFLVGNYLKEYRSVGAGHGNRVLVNDKGRESGQWVLPPHSSTVMLYRDFVSQETLF